MGGRGPQAPLLVLEYNHTPQPPGARILPSFPQSSHTCACIFCNLKLHQCTYMLLSVLLTKGQRAFTVKDHAGKDVSLYGSIQLLWSWIEQIRCE